MARPWVALDCVLIYVLILPVCVRIRSTGTGRDELVRVEQEHLCRIWLVTYLA